MYTTFLFDFYDVVRIDPYKKWLNDHGFTREGEFYEAAAQYDRGLLSFEGLMARLSELSGQSVEDIDTAFKSASRFDEDVISLIKNLKANFKIAMLSNAGGPGLRRILGERGIDILFDEVIISGETGFIKPEPQIFELALEQLGSSSNETIFIDDSLINCDAGSRLGITSIQFVGYQQLIQELKKTWY